MATQQSTSHCSFEKHDEAYSSNVNNSHHQLDGSGDYYSCTKPKNVGDNFVQPPLARAQPQHQCQGHPHQALIHTTPQLLLHQQTHLPESAATDILPYCTTEPPLRQEEVIALSDVAGSVKELVLLALGVAAGDVACAEKMEGAVGTDITGNIVEFFAEEWEVE
jgi:hypothetical protein